MVSTGGNKAPCMSFKFAIGQPVEYTPVGSGGHAKLFTVTQHMPHEDNHSERRYRIKSDGEAFCRDVFENTLSADVGPAEAYLPPVKVRRKKS